MKLIYCTSNKYPSFKFANTAQIIAMAKEFNKKLGVDFYLGGKNFLLDKNKYQIINGQTPKSYKLALIFLRYIKKNKINIIYCRESRLLFFIYLFNKFIFKQKLKYIYEIHALEEKNIINRIVEKKLASWVNKFIFITASLRDIYLKKYNISRVHTLVAPDAVDLSIFDINISKKAARNKFFPKLQITNYQLPIIAYTGKFKTMGMDKGITDILKAIKILNNKAILFIAMGGSQADINYYQKQAKELEIENQVMLKGHISQSELAIFQKACNILLMPFPNKKHYREFMSPLKMFEYMASQRPIIATDLPTIKEILNTNDAVLVKPDNPENLAQGIKQILANPSQAEKLAQQAYEDVRQYTWKKRVERIINFIK